MKKLNFYLMFTLWVFTLVLFVNSHKNNMELIEVNDQLIEIIDNQRNDYNEQYEDWNSYCNELIESYEKELRNLREELDKLLEIGFSEHEIYTLAQCVEAEAGVNRDNSQKYITQVILNRLDSDEFPDTIEEVIYEKTPRGIPQFSVAYNGMMNREVEQETLENVYDVILNGSDLPEYVEYFYSASVCGNWVNTLNVYDTVQGTVFAYK